MTAPLHPFTAMALTAAAAGLAIVLPAPAGPVGLYLLTAGCVLAAGHRRALVRATLLSLPIWFFLVLIHGVLGEAAEPVRVAGLSLDPAGLRLALGQGARLGAIIAASAALFASFRPEVLLDAVAARRGSPRLALLVIATLQAIPRLRQHAVQVLEAQRVRGLQVGGSPLARLRALGPLALPLVLGVLGEAEERAVTYATRAVGANVHRTPLFPPADPFPERLLRAVALASVPLVLAWRLVT